MLLSKLHKYGMIFCATILIAGLGACGFKPLYTGNAPGQIISADFSYIEISNIPNRSGQFLRNALIDRLYTNGRPADVRYRLKLSNPQETITQLGIKKDATATRAQMRIVTTMTLYNKFTNEIMLQRELRTMNSFNILDSQFTTRVTEQDARERALRQISDDAVRELSLFFQR